MDVAHGRLGILTQTFSPGLFGSTLGGEGGGGAGFTLTVVKLSVYQTIYMFFRLHLSFHHFSLLSQEYLTSSHLYYKLLSVVSGCMFHMYNM